MNDLLEDPEIPDAPPREAPARNSPDAAGEKSASAFPLRHLPSAAQGMAAAIARSERTPETLAGCCVLGLLSASLGAGLQVGSGPNRVTRGNLYLMPSAESGSGKSETFRHAAQPFFELERQRLKAWKEKTEPGLLAEAEVLESEIAAFRKEAGRGGSGEERAELRGALTAKRKALAEVKERLSPPSWSCEDVTSEKLAVMLARNQEQLASLSPDAGNVVNLLLGRYNRLDRTDEGIYLKAFSGDNCRVDRQGRAPVLLEHPCLSALWLVQPDKVEALLGKAELSEGGLIPRLLVCHTRALPRPIVEGMGGIAADTARIWAMLIGELIQTFRLAKKAITIEPTPEARQKMNAHHNQIVERRLSELRDVTTFAARWNEQAWRMAVCLHAGLYGEEAGERRLSGETAASAIGLADWFAGEQLQILARGRQGVRPAKWSRVLTLLADMPRGITPREVQRARIVTGADEARLLLAQMEREGELAGEDFRPPTGGCGTRIYRKGQA